MPRPRTLALVLALAATLAACTGGGSGKDKASPSGPPLVLGFINMQGAPAGSFPEAAVGARAAVAHVNDDLGGVGGRPLRLTSCTTDGTPESSQGCAQQVLAAKPVAVMSGIDLGANASVSLITRAGVPYVTGSPTLGAELTTAGAYAFTGGTAADLLGIGDYLIERKHVRSIHVLHEDLPGLLNSAISAAGDIFRAKHVSDVKLVAEKADAADFAPAVTAAAAGNPDAIVVVFPAQACARIMQAAQALGVRSELYYPGACATPGVVRAAPGGLGRSFFGSGYLPVGDSGGGADADAFRARVPKGQRSPLSEATFSTILNLAALMGDGAVDPAALRARLAATHDQPNVLAHPYTCDGLQLPLLNTVCNSNIRLLQYRDGAFTDVLGEWVTGAKLNELV
ncbi:MAG: ABC transporter substrate-binding protein, partial [Mycobacteriales bacterium]